MFSAAPKKKKSIRKSFLPIFFNKSSSAHDSDNSDNNDNDSSNDNFPADPQVNTKGGLIWHAQIVTNDFYSPKVCDADRNLKARRPLPIARSDEFFGNLEKQEDGGYIYRGPLNNWPGLNNLRLKVR